MMPASSTVAITDRDVSRRQLDEVADLTRDAGHDATDDAVRDALLAAADRARVVDRSSSSNGVLTIGVMPSSSNRAAFIASSLRTGSA